MEEKFESQLEQQRNVVERRKFHHQVELIAQNLGITQHLGSENLHENQQHSGKSYCYNNEPFSVTYEIGGNNPL